MTPNQIIELAKQSGLVRVGEGWSEPARWGMSEITRFAELVRNQVLEEAAEACERLLPLSNGNPAGLALHVDSSGAGNLS